MIFHLLLTQNSFNFFLPNIVSYHTCPSTHPPPSISTTCHHTIFSPPLPSIPFPPHLHPSPPPRSAPHPHPSCHGIYFRMRIVALATPTSPSTTSASRERENSRVPTDWTFGCWLGGGVLVPALLGLSMLRITERERGKGGGDGTYRDGRNGTPKQFGGKRRGGGGGELGKFKKNPPRREGGRHEELCMICRMKFVLFFLDIKMWAAAPDRKIVNYHVPLLSSLSLSLSRESQISNLTPIVVLSHYDSPR